jgi:hypothetical protein
MLFCLHVFSIACDCFSTLVPEGKALSAGFSTNHFPDTGLGYALAAFPSSADGEALLAWVRATLADTVIHGVPADLIAAAKRRQAANAEFQKNSISGLAPGRRPWRWKGGNRRTMIFGRFSR